MDPAFEQSEFLAAHPPARALIGEARVAEPIRYDPDARGKLRLDDLVDMLATRREHQQRFGFGVHRISQQYFAQPFSKWSAARLARHHASLSAHAQKLGDPCEVRA